MSGYDFLQSLDFDPHWGYSVDRHQYNYRGYMRLPDGTSIAEMVVSTYQPDYDKPPDVRVEFIEVDPEYRRRGVGSTLYRKMIEKIDSEFDNWSPDDLNHSLQTEEGAALWQSLGPTLGSRDIKRVYRGVSVPHSTMERLRDAEDPEEILHILGPVITRGGLHWAERREYAEGFGPVLLVADMAREEDGWWPQGGLNSGTYIVNDNRLLTLVDVEVDLGNGWQSLVGGRTASALSWRPVGRAPEQWAQEADCLIMTDVRSRKMGRRYEVWVYGRLVGNRQRLDEAKDLAERQAKAATQQAEVEWTRRLVEPTTVTHYYWGDTDEFSEPLTVYLGNVTLGLTTEASIGHDPVVRIKEVLRRVQLISDQLSKESLTALSRIEEGVAAFDAGADDLLYDRGEAARRVLAMYHGDDEPEVDRALRRVLAAMADCLQLMAHAPGYDSPMAHRAADQLEDRVEAVFGSRVASVTDRAAGLLLLHTGRDGQTRFYLTKRSDAVDDHVGTWTCPGGGMESGESVSATAIREFVEETGVQLRMVDVDSLGTFRDFSPDSGATFTTVVAESPRTFAALGSDEITADGWFTLDEMRRLDLHPGLLRNMSDIRKFML